MIPFPIHRTRRPPSSMEIADGFPVLTDEAIEQFHVELNRMLGIVPVVDTK